jgi:hypothetical protein
VKDTLTHPAKRLRPSATPLPGKNTACASPYI